METDPVPMQHNLVVAEMLYLERTQLWFYFVDVLLPMKDAEIE